MSQTTKLAALNATVGKASTGNIVKKLCEIYSVFLKETPLLGLPLN